MLSHWQPLLLNPLSVRQAVFGVLVALILGSDLSWGWAAEGNPSAVSAKLVPAGKHAEWIRSGDESKRRTALREWSWGQPEDADVVAAIAKLLQSLQSRKQGTESAFAAIDRMAACPLSAADAPLVAALSAQDWRMRMRAADALAQRPSDSISVKALQECWNSPEAARNYALKHAIVLALAESRGEFGLAAVVGLLPELQSQLRFEAISRLSQRTEQNFGDKPDAWSDWWSQRPANWQDIPFELAELPQDVPWSQPVPVFYSLKLYAQRVLFVIDISNSMRSSVDGKQRIQTAREELQRAILGLPNDAWFNIILFHEQVVAWRPGLMQATTDNRAAAIQMIHSLEPALRTATNDALERAVGEKPVSLAHGPHIEQIILVTDGKPTAGRIVSPELIVSNITQLNTIKRIRIDTLGVDTVDGPQEFLQDLSQRNYGSYHKIR